MDSASILVLVLDVGVFALLVWFEMNSRANDARRKQRSSFAQPGMSAVGKQATNIAESEAAKKKRLLSDQKAGDPERSSS